MALGADWCNSARGFMFAVGCIQSQSCHTDRCPTGVATQDPTRQRALVVPDKAERVHNFHRATLQSLAELTAAAGLDHPSGFTLGHFQRRISASDVASFSELYPRLLPRELLDGTTKERWRVPWDMADPHSFRPAQSLSARNLSALPITETDDSDIAAAETMGPNSRKAANGTPTTL